MDRRPLGAALPAHRRRDRLARDPAVAARARTTRRLIAVLAGLVLVAALAAGGVVLYLSLRPGPPPLIVGVDDDTLKWTGEPLAVVRRQQALGADAVRIWVPWNGGTRPNGTRKAELARAETAARRTRVVLAVFGPAARSPLTAPARERFCSYARAALALVPDARAVVVWNEANSATAWRGGAAGYERLLARCFDLLHAVRPDVDVLDSTASAHAPAAFLLGVAAALRASGRSAPIVDGFGHNPYPRTSAESPLATHPAGFLGEGDYERLAATLRDGFSGTPQHALDVWYLEDGFQTQAPRSSGYTGRETAVTVTPATQAERLRTAIRLAACQPTVRAFFNFELVDEPSLAGWQSGLIWRGRGRKPAADAFRAAAEAARSGSVSCP
ncbi:MAG TPA: hypothetical protein VFJ91_06305 [Gaiellaceae bacterium]|nr:hypothetical protein [Gaiellaceae bacterium]